MHFKLISLILVSLSAQVTAQNQNLSALQSSTGVPALVEYEKCLGMYQYVQSRQPLPMPNIQAVANLFSSSIYVLSEGVPDNFNAQSQANLLHISLMRMNSEQQVEHIQKVERTCVEMLRTQVQQVMQLSVALSEKQKNHFTHTLSQGQVSLAAIDERKAFLMQQKGLFVEDTPDLRKISFRRAMGSIKEEVTHLFTLPSHRTHPAIYFVAQKIETGRTTQTIVSGSYAGNEKAFASFLLALQLMNR